MTKRNQDTQESDPRTLMKENFNKYSKLFALSREEKSYRP